MIDLSPDVGVTGDREEFLDRFQHVGAFIAHMGYVHAVVFGSDFRQGYQLIGVSKAPRRVDQG